MTNNNQDVKTDAIKRYSNQEIAEIYSVKNKALPKDLIKQANSVSLMDYLDKKGEMYKHFSGGTYCLAEHDSLKFTPSENDAFKWHSRGDVKGYGAIQFAMKYYGMDFRSGVRDVLESADEMIIPVKEKTRIVDNKEPYKFEPSRLRTNTQKVEQYLVHERGIDEVLVEKLIDKGMIREKVNTANKGKENEKDYHNAIFLWQRNGEVIGHEERGADKNSSFKGIAPGVPENRGFVVTMGQPEKVFVFESTIDALSYASMYPTPNSRYISMNGLKSKTMYQAIKDIEIDRGKPPEHVVICTDNDKAGRDFADKYAQKIEMKGQTIEFHKSIPPTLERGIVTRTEKIDQVLETIDRQDVEGRDLSISNDDISIKKNVINQWIFKTDDKQYKYSEKSNEREIKEIKEAFKDIDMQVTYKDVTKDWNEVLIKSRADNTRVQQPIITPKFIDAETKEPKVKRNVEKER